MASVLRALLGAWTRKPPATPKLPELRTLSLRNARTSRGSDASFHETAALRRTRARQQPRPAGPTIPKGYKSPYTLLVAVSQDLRVVIMTLSATITNPRAGGRSGNIPD